MSTNSTGFNGRRCAFHMMKGDLGSDFLKISQVRLHSNCGGDSDKGSLYGLHI